MPLNCTCNEEWDGEDGWCYHHPEDFTTLNTERARRCSSCKTLIKVGSECLKFTREAACEHDIEFRIYGDTRPIAPMYLCEACGEIWLNLTDAGFCIPPDDNMPDCMKEYHELTGFRPEAYKIEEHPNV